MALRTLKRYAFAFAVSALVANALLGDRGLVEILHARREARAVAREVAALRAENAALRVEAQRLRSDPVAIEAIARRELGLKREDEQVVVVRRR